MVVHTVWPVRELSAADKLSAADRISPTPMTSGCFTQHPLQKKILIDVQRRVLAGAGQQMYYGIKDIALRIPLDQIKFAAAFFNGNKAPVIGHIGQQPGHDRGFAGAGGAGNADGHPISDTGSQKVKHFSGGTSGVQQFFLH